MCREILKDRHTVRHIPCRGCRRTDGRRERRLRRDPAGARRQNGEVAIRDRSTRCERLREARVDVPAVIVLREDAEAREQAQQTCERVRVQARRVRERRNRSRPFEQDISNARPGGNRDCRSQRERCQEQLPHLHDRRLLDGTSGQALPNFRCRDHHCPQ
jgi:hypothetical protein